MAFPTTAVLDSGVRANESPATGWTDGPDGDVYGGVKILSNQIAPITTDAWSYFTGAGPFAGSIEAYRTVAVASGDHTIELLQDVGPGGPNGYSFGCTGASAAATISRTDANENTELGAGITLPAVLTAGDGIGLARIAGSITCWHRIGAGAWTLVGTEADATYTGASYVGAYFSSVNGRTTNVGGGVVVVSGGGGPGSSGAGGKLALLGVG